MGYILTTIVGLHHLPSQRFGAGEALLAAADGLGIRAGTGKLSAGCEESATARGFSAIVESWGQNGVNYSGNKWDHFSSSISINGHK